MDYLDRNREEKGSATELQERCSSPADRQGLCLTGGSPKPKGKWEGLQHFRDGGSKVQRELKFEK